MQTNKLKKLVLVAALAGASIAGVAQAAQDQNGPYVGIQAGETFLSNNGGNGNTGMYGAYAGYQVHEAFAVELGAAMGKKDGVTLTAYDLSVIPRIAIGQTGAGVLIKAGGRYSNASYQGYSVNGWSPVIGAGVDYRFTPAVSARVMYDYATRAYGVSGTNAGTVTAGVSYKF